MRTENPCTLMPLQWLKCVGNVDHALTFWDTGSKVNLFRKEFTRQAGWEGLPVVQQLQMILVSLNYFQSSFFFFEIVLHSMHCAKPHPPSPPISGRNNNRVKYFVLQIYLIYSNEKFRYHKKSDLTKNKSTQQIQEINKSSCRNPQINLHKSTHLVQEIKTSRLQKPTHPVENMGILQSKMIKITVVRMAGSKMKFTSLVLSREVNPFFFSSCSCYSLFCFLSYSCSPHSCISSS